MSENDYTLTDKINSISDEIFKLEQSIVLKDALIALVAPDIEWKEQHLLASSDERMRKIVETYRKIYPKPTTQEG